MNQSLGMCMLAALALPAVLAAGCGKKPAPELPRVDAASEARTPVFEVFSLRDCAVDLLDVAMGTNGFGVIGGVGVILVTDDFGARWHASYGPVEKGAEFESVLLAGPGSAWCISRSLLLRTVDGGRVWTECAKPPGNFYYFGSAAFAGDTLFLLQPPTSGAAVHTTRNGQEWGRLPALLPRNDYEVLWFVDEKRGWVAGNYGRFASTVDGGGTWTKHDLAGDPHAVDVQFLDAARGWIRVAGTAQRLMRTVDGGASWHPSEAIPLPARAVRDMQWFTPERGVVLAEVKTGKTQVLRTDDGGKTWSLVGEHDADLYAMHFLAPGRGWVVGRNGRVCRYGH